MEDAKRQLLSIKKISTYLVHTLVPAWHFTERQAALLKKLLPEAEVRICGSAEEFVGSLHDTDAVLTWTFQQEWFAGANRLKILSTPAAGKDY